MNGIAFGDVEGVTTTGASPGGDPSDDVEGQSRVLEEFRNAGQVAEWREDPDSGRLYRHATAGEMLRNGWAPGTFLVAFDAFASAVDGSEAFKVLLPYDEATTEVVDFTHVETVRDQPASLTDGDGVTRTFSLDVNRYITWGAEHGGFLTTTSDGGLHGRVLLMDRQLEIRGSTPDLDEIPGPSGEIIREADVLRVFVGATAEEDPCGFVALRLGGTLQGPFTPFVRDDGEDVACQSAVALGGSGYAWLVPIVDDEARDDTVAITATSYNIGMMGEGKFCTANSDKFTIMSNLADDIQAGFSDTNANIVHAGSHCWTASSTSVAEDCDAGIGSCGDYPYYGCDSNRICYVENAWDDVAESRSRGWNPAPLHLAQVVHEGTMEGYCGRANDDPGASVTLADISGTGCRNYVHTHEAGHNFRGAHGGAALAGPCGSPIGGTEYMTVMAQSSEADCRLNEFSSTNVDNVNSCVSSSGCPRSGTG